MLNSIYCSDYAVCYRRLISHAHFLRQLVSLLQLFPSSTLTDFAARNTSVNTLQDKSGDGKRDSVSHLTIFNFSRVLAIFPSKSIEFFSFHLLERTYMACTFFLRGGKTYSTATLYSQTRVFLYVFHDVEISRLEGTRSGTLTSAS